MTILRYAHRSVTKSRGTTLSAPMPCLVPYAGLVVMRSVPPAEKPGLFL